MMAKIGIIDYGAGNFTSVWNAMKSFSTHLVKITHNADFDNCSHIILPGVGAFGAAMTKITNMGILDKLEDEILIRKKPYLGICVGMQITTEIGKEFGVHQGFGWIPGSVEIIAAENKNIRLPHMGWNNLTEMDNSPLFHQIERNADFYFVHSYYLKLHTNAIKTVNVDYGMVFPAAFSYQNIHGVQFHPEKSQYYGIKLLENFVNLACDYV